VSAAAEELVREQIRSMPVVEGGTLVGIVSRADLITRALVGGALAPERQLAQAAPAARPPTPSVRSSAQPADPPPAVREAPDPAGATARPARSPSAAARARLVNPVVRRVLRSPAHRVLSGSVLLLEYTGHRSGERHELPAMFAAAGDRLVVIAGRPGTKTWWHNFGRRPQAVTATVAGRRRTYRAVRPDAATDLYRQALETYRRRFPRVSVPSGTPLIVLVPGDQP
jgi:CBS domain protein/F420H(2)-dependent quinone reductase